MSNKLKDLPNFKNLSKEEKERLNKIHGHREKIGYNLSGNSSISRKELSKSKKEAKKLEDE